MDKRIGLVGVVKDFEGVSAIVAFETKAGGSYAHTFPLSCLEVVL